MKDRRRPPVIIVGAHRSGTSATARSLELLGLQIGQHLDSHCEPRGLQKLHDEYLQRVGASWHDPQPLLDWIATPEGRKDCISYLRRSIEREFAAVFGYRHDPKGIWLRMKINRGTPWGWKEPRTTLFAPAWLEIFPNARILHVARDTLAAAESIRERELKFQEAGDPPIGNLGDLDYCRRLVEIYFRAASACATTPRYLRFEFEELQSNPPAMLEQLADFCGLPVTTPKLATATASIRPARTKSTYR